MLKQFAVPEDIAVRIPGDAMRGAVHEIFTACGMPQDDATRSTDTLLYADLRGIDSHGVSNMLRAYVAGFQSGDINPTPNWTVERDAPAAATIDCDRGLGLTVGPRPWSWPSRRPAIRASPPSSATTADTSAPPPTTPRWRSNTT